MSHEPVSTRGRSWGDVWTLTHQLIGFVNLWIVRFILFYSISYHILFDILSKERERQRQRKRKWESALSIMVIVVKNGYGEPSSNPGQGVIVPYNAECYARRHQVPFHFLVFSMTRPGMDHHIPDHWIYIYTQKLSTPVFWGFFFSI